ncbi:unnamed protein product [Rotaria magnacalcarata]
MVFKLSSSHKLTNDRYPVVYRNNVRFARPPPSNSSRSPSAEKLIVEFMEKAWELPKPNLVISVTGRMERFKWPSLRARYDFQRGLIAAANATNYKDLTQEQTEIIPCENKHQHILRPWRSNTFADRTRRPLGKALNIDEIIMKSPLASQNITNYKQLKKIYRNHSIMPNTKSDSLSLAPNHTHFVLLDNIKMNSTNNQTPYGGVNTTIDLRVEIEYQIKETFKVPMIHILADDDALAAATICTALEHDLPVILIEGTGRAVNKFAEWYRSLYGDKLMNPQVYRSDDIYEEAQNSNFETFKQKVQNENQPDVINTLEKEKFLEALMSKKGYKLIWIIQFINDQGRTKLDEVIFYALFNATSMIRSGEVREVQEFKLAMAWNKFDHIQPNLFIDRNKFKWTNEQLDEELACAISTNKVRFTDLLVKQGASFNRLRTKMQFEKLYNDKDFLPLLKDYLRNDVDNESDLPKLRQFNSAYELNPQQNEHSESFRCQNNLNHCDETPHKTSATAFNCVFNDTDMIQENGLIDSISIQYNEYLPEDSPIVPICWLVSSTNKPGVVVLVRKTQPLLQVKKTNSFVDYAFPSTEKLYVTTGQYLAFIFLDKKYFPVKVTGKNQYCGQLTWYSNNGEEIEIVEKKDQGVGINFVVNPLPDFVHDFFLWSLFADHHKMATYLCSRSTNSIASALFASKIYHQAAEITLEHEKRLQYRQREREFAEHASNIIDKCFTEGEQFALDMLHMESASHQNYSAWKLAKVIDSRVFLATRTVQRNLDYKWYGRIRTYLHNDLSLCWLRFIVCIIPLLILLPPVYNLLVAEEEEPPIQSSSKKENTKTICDIFRQLKQFYTRPIIRFYYNIVFYVGFLMLFSFVLLVDYFPLNNNGGIRNTYKNLLIPVTEILVHILTWSLIIEEGIEFYWHWKEERKYRNHHIVQSYFMKDKWNILDMLAIVFYLIGFITRFIVNEPVFVASKIFMSFTLFLWYIRLLHIFVAFELFGPKLLMIFNTMIDLLFFICFVVIFFVSYATTTYALISTAKQVTWKKTTDGSLSHEYSLMNNGTGLWNWNVLGGVIHWGVWKVYGEVQLNDEDNPFFKPGEISNDAYGIITFIITIVFVCVSNILLMNVLIALFNITIQNVERDVHETLGYHRFRLVLEYSKKSHLPPPLNVLIYIFYPLVRRIVKALNKREYGIHNVDDNLDIDSNLFNRVVFNYKDCIQTSNGLIKKVTIQFSPLHSIGESPVAAYILSPEKQNSSTFRIRDKTRFRHDNLGGVGTRRMTFDTPLTCYEGDVLALEFSSKSRIPVCVRDRNEYSTSSEYFHEAEKQGPIKFDNYPSFGAAFSFIVENSTEDEEKTNQEVEMTGINDQLIRSKQPNKSRSFSRKKAMTHTDTSNSSNSGNSIHTQFEKNDIIFRASSIAEDYWRSKIEEIKRQEAQLADEDTHLIVSSSVSNFQN